MPFLLGLFASIALAAPQAILEHRDVLSSDPLPTAPPDGHPPPPLNVGIGDVHALESLVPGDVRGVDRRDVEPPNSLVIETAAPHTMIPVATPIVTPPKVKQQDAPPLEIADGGKRPLIPIRDLEHVLQKRKVKKPAQTKKPQQSQLPPGIAPLVLKTGGERTLQAVGRPIGKRQEETSAPAAFTTMTPWPGASGIPITEQHQPVTTYNPSTICQAEPTHSLISGSQPHSVCTTTLIAQETHVCASTLLPLAAAPITVTDCEQYITYSSQYGYNLARASDAASATEQAQYVDAIQTVTTYHAAIWTDVKSGAKPTGGIEVVCSQPDTCVTSTLPVTTPSITAAPASGGEHITATTSVFHTRTTTVTAPELRT